MENQDIVRKTLRLKRHHCGGATIVRIYHRLTQITLQPYLHHLPSLPNLLLYLSKVRKILFLFFPQKWSIFIVWDSIIIKYNNIANFSNPYALLDLLVLFFHVDGSTIPMSRQENRRNGVDIFSTHTAIINKIFTSPIVPLVMQKVLFSKWTWVDT